jgi:hypothetical protein
MKLDKEAGSIGSTDHLTSDGKGGYLHGGR